MVSQSTKKSVNKTCIQKAQTTAKRREEGADDALDLNKSQMSDVALGLEV